MKWVVVEHQSEQVKSLIHIYIYIYLYIYLYIYISLTIKDNSENHKTVFFKLVFMLILLHRLKKKYNLFNELQKGFSIRLYVYFSLLIKYNEFFKFFILSYSYRFMPYLAMRFSTSIFLQI